MRSLIAVAGVFLALVAPEASDATRTESLLKTIKAVGREGAGNDASAHAWKELVAQGPDALIDVLTAMRDKEAISDNWLRPAVDAILEKSPAVSKGLSAKLETFVRDKTHAGSARRIAYEILVKADPKTPSRLLPEMLLDPCPDLRRDAVAQALLDARRSAIGDETLWQC